MTDSIAVVGGGPIGVGWSVILAASGFEVRLYETDGARRAGVIEEVGAILDRLAAYDLSGSPPATALARVTTPDSLEAATAGTAMIIECVTESLDVKRAVFAELDGIAPVETVIASASSSLTISEIAGELPGRHRCLLAHPANPPYLLPVVEVAPAPFTSEEAVAVVAGVVERCGMTPVRIGVEIEGLAYNRLQGALLREAYCLVRDGVISPVDLDRLVTDGLGKRWSVVGPFATAHLNTRGGIAAHATRLGDAYARMGAERGQDDPWTPELVARVETEVAERLPVDDWEEHVTARDTALMELSRTLRHVARPGEKP